MKKIILVTIIFFLIATCLFLIGFKIWDYYENTTAEKYYAVLIEKKILIERGASSLAIAQLLEDNKLIVSANFFTFYSKHKKIAQTLKAGEYLIKNNLTNMQILELLNKGSNVFYKVTVPEGLTIKETAELLASKTAENIKFDARAFIDICNNNIDYIIQTTGIKTSSAEGFLFPETYTYTKDDNENTLFKAMITRFKKQTEKFIMQPQPLSMSFYDTLKLAAIVQKEATIIDEMPAIAGVYLNRLRIGMKLDADPTVVYALGYYKPRLLYEDLKIESPYNTYKYKGLTPTPICNPGEAAIQHTINYENHNFLFFVAGIDGRHKFSRTNNEHNINRSKIRRQRTVSQRKQTEIKTPVKKRTRPPQKRK